jgi:hypothetical protein
MGGARPAWVKSLGSAPWRANGGFWRGCEGKEKDTAGATGKAGGPLRTLRKHPAGHFPETLLIADCGVSVAESIPSQWEGGWESLEPRRQHCIEQDAKCAVAAGNINQPARTSTIVIEVRRFILTQAATVLRNGQ